MSDLANCAECGHLHFLGVPEGYTTCPVEGCDCKGQEWAQVDPLQAAVDSFGRWWEHGRKRLPGHESFLRERCESRFVSGWRDAEEGVSDFKRRGLPHETGERAAYMAGRFLSSARVVSDRVLSQ